MAVKAALYAAVKEQDVGRVELAERLVYFLSAMTPTVFREGGYRFFFFSREEERMHVHVLSADGEAKFWLEPEIKLARNHGYPRSQLKLVESMVGEH